MKKTPVIILIVLIGVTIPILLQGIGRSSFDIRLLHSNEVGIPLERALPVNVSDVIGDVWHHQERFSRFTFPLGEEFMIDTNIVYGPSPGASPAIAFDGTNYFIVWRDKRGGDLNVYGARVSSDGEILDPVGIPICTAVGRQLYPAVAFGETNYLVVWQDERGGPFDSFDIYGARVSVEGVVLDTSGITISTHSAGKQLYPSVVWNGSNFLVVWQDNRADVGDIYGSRVSPEGIVLDTIGIPISSTASSQYYPSVTSDGKDYFVVWDDGRNVTSDIYGSRIDSSGTVLDPIGIPICTTGSGSRNTPSVAFDGTNYLVAWQYYKSGGYSICDIYGTRVSPNGVVLDTENIAICTTGNYQINPSVTFDGVNYLVVWREDYLGNDDISGARVSPDGTVLDAGGIPIFIAEDNQCRPSVVAGNTNYLVVWEDWRGHWNIWGTRVTFDGGVLDSEGIIVSTEVNSQLYPSVAFGGNNYLVVWEDDRNIESDGGIYGMHISPEGTSREMTVIPISLDEGRSPSVSSCPINYLAVWTGNGDDIFGSRVGIDGTVLDSVPIPISVAGTWQGASSVAFGGVNYLAVWMKYGGGGGYNYDIYGSRVTPDGVVLDTAGIPICTVSGAQRSPVAAFDGTNWLVVWFDHRTANDDIYGCRINADGMVLDTQNIVILTAPGYQQHPSIAFDGTNYLVVWIDYNIYGSRVTPQGVVLDPGGFLITTEGYNLYNVSVVFNGTNYLVIWEDSHSGSFNADVHAKRVSPNATVIDSEDIVISSRLGYEWWSTLAHGPADQCLIVYSGEEGIPYNTRRIFGVLHTETGIEENKRFKAQSLKFKVHPNPFLHSTIITYHLPLKTKVSLKIYDITGRFLETLTNEDKEPGSHNVNFNAKDLTSGIYFIKFTAGDYKSTKKLIILR